MARIYGTPESEKEILRYCPMLERFEDIDNTHQKSKIQLEKEKKEFSDKLPEKIKEQEEILKKIRNDKEETIQQFDNKIEEIKDKIEIHKHNKKWFLVISNHLQNFFQKYISKPWNVRKIKKSEVKQKRTLNRWKENSYEIFKEENEYLIDEIDFYDDIKNEPYYQGAKGEVEVLNKLKKLGDEHAILCGLNLELDQWVNYNGNFDLKSAQMDLVVVSPKGVFVIEVKNWSTQHYNENKDLSPHEQVDRAGRVMYKFLESKLKNEIEVGGNRLNKVLIPIQNNISRDPSYEYVRVSSVKDINNFITNRKDVLYNFEVDRIIDELSPFVT